MSGVNRWSPCRHILTLGFVQLTKIGSLNIVKTKLTYLIQLDSNSRVFYEKREKNVRTPEIFILLNFCVDIMGKSLPVFIAIFKLSHPDTEKSALLKPTFHGWVQNNLQSPTVLCVLVSALLQHCCTYCRLCPHTTLLSAAAVD